MLLTRSIGIRCSRTAPSPRQQPRQRRAGDLADAPQEFGAHVGGVARRVGRREHQQAEGDRAGAVAQRDHRDRARGAGIVEPADRLEAGVDAAIRHRQAAREDLDVVADRLRELERRERLVGAPDADRALRDQEPVEQLAHQHVGQVGRVRRQHQRLGPLMQLVGDRGVVLAVPDHLDQLLLETLDLVAQHFHLPLLQRHRAMAVRAGQLHGSQQLGMALEEARAVGEVVRDVGLGDALDAHG